MGRGGGAEKEKRKGESVINCHQREREWERLEKRREGEENEVFFQHPLPSSFSFLLAPKAFESSKKGGKEGEEKSGNFANKARFCCVNTKETREPPLNPNLGKIGKSLANALEIGKREGTSIAFLVILSPSFLALKEPSLHTAKAVSVYVHSALLASPSSSFSLSVPNAMKTPEGKKRKGGRTESPNLSKKES